MEEIGNNGQMDLESIRPHMEVERISNSRRLVGRARDNDQTEAALTQKSVKFREASPDLDVRAAFASHVVGLAAKIDSNQFQRGRIGRFVEAVRCIEQAIIEPRAGIA